MATRNTINRAFVIFQQTYPGYFKGKTAEQLETILSVWANNFKHTPDSRFMEAVELVINDLKFFPSIVEMDDKCHRADMIANQKLVTYQARVDHLKELEEATEAQIEHWVDMRRFLFPDESCTTKDFKERIDVARAQVEKAKAELSADQKEALGL